MSRAPLSTVEDLRAFVPLDLVDAHAHLLRRCDASPAVRAWLGDDSGDLGLDCYGSCVGDWLGRRPAAGVFFALPVKSVDFHAANEFVRLELAKSPASRGLLMVGPEDDPALVESTVTSQGWAGLKPYHLFARRVDTYEAQLDEYVPEWCWEIANRWGLVIMLHLVRARALADASNQQALQSRCRRYPNAKVVLAHAGRGFCARHTVEGAGALVGLDNIYFDTSAICESTPHEVILRLFGPGRLLFGTDFPVSEMRGRCVSIGDGFAWLDENSVNWSGQPFAKPERVGYESLLALRHACWLSGISDEGVERIFAGNARQLFKLGTDAAKVTASGNSFTLSNRPS